MCRACRDNASILRPVRSRLFALLLAALPAKTMGTSEHTQVWSRLEELCGQREADGSEVGHADESEGPTC